MNAIFKRRSVRKYRPGEVTDKQVELMLKAAMRAPSAGNEQPWHFIVIRDRKTLDRIPEIHPYSNMLRGAALAILVCGAPEEQAYPLEYWPQDCAAAMENLLLAATELGLGSVWLGVYPVEERMEGMRDLLCIPESIMPLGIASIGYAAEEKEHGDTFNTAKIHREKW